MNLKKIGKVFSSKFVGTGPSSDKKEFTGPRSHKDWETLLYITCSVLYYFLSEKVSDTCCSVCYGKWNRL